MYPVAPPQDSCRWPFSSGEKDGGAGFDDAPFAGTGYRNVREALDADWLLHASRSNVTAQATNMLFISSGGGDSESPAGRDFRQGRRWGK